MKRFRFEAFTVGSAPYVVRHAKFQASKGKNPSVPFKGILDPRKALAMAKQAILKEKEREKLASVKLENEVASRPRTWREDSRSNEYPTVSFEVVHSIDLVGIASVFEAHVFHVNTIRGKGFRGNASCGGTSASTDSYIGTGEEQYEQALLGALKLLAKFVAEIDESVKKNYELYSDIHNGNYHKRRLASLPKSGRTKLSRKK